MAPTQMTSRDLSPQFAVLGFIYFQAMHGYELHKQLQANLSEIWSISQSQMYAILKRLEKQGWIVAQTQLQQNRLPREQFSLTEWGKQRFEDWLFKTTPCNVRAIRVEFLTRMFFASHISEDVCSRLLQDQVEKTQKEYQRMQIRLLDTPPDQKFNRLGLELKTRQLQTMLKWLESCELKIFSLD